MNLRELDPTAAPSAAEIRAALSHILDSGSFPHSPKLAAFLKFVVETTLAGDGDGIKAYTIAVDGLGRPPDFNPETAAIVRVHANRVRRALKRYYAIAGIEAMMVIDLPRRRYVPIFSRRPLRAISLTVSRHAPQPWASEVAQSTSRSRQFVSGWIDKLLRRSPQDVDR